MRARLAAGLMLACAAAAYLAGFSWGVPATARFQKVLLPEQRSDEFFAAVEANRRSLYARIGENIQAAFGRGEWSGELEHGDVRGGVAVHPPGPPDPVLLHGFSAFALRSVEQDEQFALNALARFKPRRLDFNPRSSLYGGSYLYPLAGALAGLHVLGAATLTSDALAYYRDPDKIGRLYEAGRALSALSALASAWLLLLIGRESVGEEEALWGAALFALAPGVVAYAHVFKPHLTACLYALACARYGLRWAREGRRVDALRAGLFLGLATGASKNLMVLGPALAAAALVPGPLAWRRRAGDLAAAAALSVAVFFLTNPYVLAGWRDFLDEARGLTAWYRSSLSLAGLWGFVASAWRAGAGAPAWALGLAGLALALARRRGEDFRLAVFLAALLLGTSYVAGSRGEEIHSARFFFPGLGLAALLGARAALTPPGRARWAGRAVLAAALAVLGLDAARAGRNFAAGVAGRSNADAAGAWIEANLPPGAEIGAFTPAPMSDRFPPIAFSRYAYVFVQPPVSAADPKRLPRWFVTRPDWPGGEGFARAYAPLRVFDALAGRRDRFTAANFPVAVYERKLIP